MPRDHKAPLIQKIARKASATFKSFQKSSNNGDDEDFLAVQAELVVLVSALRAADLNISPRTGDDETETPGPKEEEEEGEEEEGPPVTYMHICETDAFSMGVFLLRRGASIPLHDHPGMNGVLKVLYGKVSIRSFDKLEPPDEEETTSDGNHQSPSPYPQFDPPLPEFQSGSPRRCVLRSVADFSADSAPCVLSPQRDNVHQIDAAEGPAAFLDILSPPYDPEDGRDCHYYRVLRPASAGEETGEENQDEEEESWLLEVPQPEDFWCGGEPYPGPVVSV